MDHGVYFIKDSSQREAFSGLVLPDVLPRLEDRAVLLIGAVEGNLPVGAAVMELEASRAQLLSIAVAADHKRKGIGSALLRQCVRMLRRTSVQSLYAILTEEETEITALFSSFGMKPAEEAGAYYRFSLDSALQQSVLGGTHHRVIPLEGAFGIQLRDYLGRTFHNGPAAVQAAEFDPKISQVLIENGQITACLLMEYVDEMLSVSWLSSQSREKLAVLYLLRGALQAAAAVYPPETQVQFATYEPAVAKLTEQLLPQAEKTSVRSWELAYSGFRLTDTTPAKWERETGG